MMLRTNSRVCGVMTTWSKVERVMQVEPLRPQM